MRELSFEDYASNDNNLSKQRKQGNNSALDH